MRVLSLILVRVVQVRRALRLRMIKLCELIRERAGNSLLLPPAIQRVSKWHHAGQQCGVIPNALVVTLPADTSGSYNETQCGSNRGRIISL